MFVKLKPYNDTSGGHEEFRAREYYPDKWLRIVHDDGKVYYSWSYTREYKTCHFESIGQIQNAMRNLSKGAHTEATAEGAQVFIIRPPPPIPPDELFSGTVSHV